MCVSVNITDCVLVSFGVSVFVCQCFSLCITLFTVAVCQLCMYVPMCHRVCIDHQYVSSVCVGACQRVCVTACISVSVVHVSVVFVCITV